MPSNIRVHVWRNVKRWGLPTSHFGHAAVSLLDQATGATNAYISWWPGEGAGKKQALTNQLGGANPDHLTDQVSEMNMLTALRLEVGHRQANGIPVPQEWLDYLNDVGKAPINAPRTGQNRLGTLDANGLPMWSQSNDEEVDIPGLGGGHMPWGLSSSEMAEFWRQWDVPGREYRLASKTSSCAGVAAQALGEGGGNAYSKGPTALIYMEPNQIYDWANAIRSATFSLNLESVHIRRETANLQVAQGDLNRVWTSDEWIKASAVDWKIRSILLRSIDSALVEFHRAAAFQPRFTALVKVFRGILKHRESHPESKRTIAMLVLAEQVIRHAEGLD